jgi:hypothetical protein
MPGKNLRTENISFGGDFFDRIEAPRSQRINSLGSSFPDRFSAAEIMSALAVRYEFHHEKFIDSAAHTHFSANKVLCAASWPISADVTANSIISTCL